jgi:hypothetical protein
MCLHTGEEREMAYLWELEEEVFEQIKAKVIDHVSEKYSDHKLGIEYLIEESVDTYPPEVKFKFGWIVFFENRIVYLKSAWWSERSVLKTMEIEEAWAVDGISDYGEVRFEIERTDETVKLIMRHRDTKKMITSCPVKHYDGVDIDYRYPHRKLQAEHFRDVMARLYKMIKGMG